MNEKLKSFLPHIIAVLFLLALALIYNKPIFENKVLYQYDVIQSAGAAKEVQDFKAKTGETALWTNSMFGGMPTYTITGKYPNALTSDIASFITYLIPQPANVIFFLLLGFYIMMAALRFNPWVSVMGAIGFAFCSYNFISLEAGHISKVLAVAYAPPLIGGAILLFRGKYLIGSIITAFFMIMELYSNHVQITYYLFLALLLYGVYELIRAIMSKQIKQFLIASILMIVISGLTLGSMASRFWTTYEYSQHTIRGASELKTNTQSKGGLDKDYAFSWSYGVGETFTFLVPNIFGGQSQGKLDKESEIYKVVSKNYGAGTARNFIQGMPLYWGDQPNTGGPAYMGAIIIFLFIFSFFVVKDPMKWWILSVVVLFTMLSWGKNFPALSDLFFDNVPLYNKFRAVTMIHSLVSLMMCFMAVWGVKVITESNINKDQMRKYLYGVTGAIGGLLLIFVLMGGAFFTFEREKVEGEPNADESFLANLERMTQDKKIAEDIYDALLADRQDLMQDDSLRSLMFILLAAGLIWLFIQGKLQARFVYGGLILLVLVDMWAVDKRYLNTADFLPNKKYQANFEPSEADQMILKDPDPNYRVLNQTVSPFNDATTSYFHKSIGGYSAAKMRRYQDLNEKYISVMNMNVLNMLNTKYIIQDREKAGPFPARNPGALGNAWFVDSIRWVNNPDEEINSLKDFNPARTVIIDKKYKQTVGDIKLNPDTASSIKLTEYKPNKLVYESNSGISGLAVFSEIYYNNTLGWESYIDGKPAPHFRVNYILRGMVIPQGKHKIEFVFHPESYYTGETIALICSIILLGGIIGITVIKVRGKGEDKEFILKD